MSSRVGIYAAGVVGIICGALFVVYIFPAFSEPRTGSGEEPKAPGGQTVSLFYYDPARDEDESGTVMCSRDGLVPVERTLPQTETPIQDTISTLLRGEITDEEARRGITTEYPLSGFELTGADLDDGSLTLAFRDPDRRSQGGACRAGILWYQIEQTALQFDAVEEVQFEPETLFQP